MRIVLVRHGESAHQAYADRGLTERGVRQVQTLGAFLAVQPEFRDCSRLVSSPLPRACQTAEQLARVLLPREVSFDADLREMNDGLTPDEPLPRETFSSFAGRVEEVLNRLALAEPARDTLVVTHAGVIVASILARFGVLGASRRARLEPSHASITVWDCAAEAWVLERYNYVPC